LNEPEEIETFNDPKQILQIVPGECSLNLDIPRFRNIPTGKHVKMTTLNHPSEEEFSTLQEYKTGINTVQTKDREFNQNHERECQTRTN